MQCILLNDIKAFIFSNILRKIAQHTIRLKGKINWIVFILETKKVVTK